MNRPLTLSRIREAITHAATENRDSHCAEVAFARRIQDHPQILTARLGRIRYVCSLLGVTPGAVLLDVGAGIGINSVLSLMCGVQLVHSVEMSEDRFRSAKLIADFLGVKDRVHLHREDVLTLDLPSASIDVAFSFELLEHISDLGALYGNIRRWTKSRSRVYARTGANGRNVIYQRTFKNTWDKIDDENYTSVRADIVRSVAPNAPDDVVSTLVARTRGDMADDVRRVAAEYVRTGALPAPRPPRAPRDPYTAQYMERLLDPYATAAVMNSHGFETSILAPNFANITTTNPFLAAAYRGAGALIRATFPASLVVTPWLEFLSRRSN